MNDNFRHKNDEVDKIGQSIGEIATAVGWKHPYFSNEFKGFIVPFPKPFYGIRFAVPKGSRKLFPTEGGVMAGKHTFFIVVLAILMTQCVVAQTPTPLPGTPAQLTCMTFTSSPGLPGVEEISNWEYLDRACILLENTSGTAIEISQCQGYFSQTQNPIEVHIRIWEVQQYPLLPDVLAACTQVSVTYGFGFDPIPGFPDVALITFDLEHYDGGSVPMPVINPGKKYIVEFMNLMDEQGSGIPGMRVDAELVGQCPTSFQNGTNIFFDYDEDVPSNSAWYYKEDIGLATNYYMGVTYYDGADPRAPSMGVFGIIALVVFISLAIVRRRS